jgi:hypothetical protein
MRLSVGIDDEGVRNEWWNFAAIQSGRKDTQATLEGR